ncbi:MAG: hypothetical protein LBU06_03115 [Desulfovibrio sp.]|nr:hypothetical protein [Desulfovibrio sp.]
MRTDIFSWTILLVMLTSALAVFLSLGGGGAEKSDPLHVNLMSYSAYVKNGFEPAYASLTDPKMTEWEVQLPAGHGKSILISQLSGKGLTSPQTFEFLSPRKRMVQDYTLLIPFTMHEGVIASLYGANPVTPGLYLAGIGENWEIYINGNVVARQLYLDKSDEIVSFRSKRGVSIPLDRRALREGDNFLVIHIVGAPGSEYTGLFYSSPYYIGDFTRMVTQSESLQTIAVCAVYIFLGLYHILLYFLRKTDNYNLLFGLFSNIVAVYFFARCPAIYSMFADSADAQRIEFGALYLLVFSLTIFLETLSINRLKPATIGYGVSCCILVTLQSVFPIWFAYDLLKLWYVYGAFFFSTRLLRAPSMVFCGRRGKNMLWRASKAIRARFPSCCSGIWAAQSLAIY